MENIEEKTLKPETATITEVVEIPSLDAEMQAELEALDEEWVEESSYKDRNVEIHGRWVAAKAQLDEATAKNDQAQMKYANRKIARIGNEFVEANKGLAGSVAKIFYNSGNDASKDYMQAALSGMWEAFLKWDPSREVTFGTFSRLYIRGATHRSVRMNEYSQLSQTDFDVRSKVTAKQRELTDSLGRAPSYAEIAKETGHTIKSVERALSKKAMSLETPVNENGGTLGDLIGDQEASSGLTEESIQALQGLFGELNECELWVIVQRFGLAGGEPQNLVEVADSIGIGREIARRTEGKAIEKLAAAAARQAAAE